MLIVTVARPSKFPVGKELGEWQVLLAPVPTSQKQALKQFQR